jgi:hypothetical protein
LNRNESGRFGALKFDSTHHFLGMPVSSQGHYVFTVKLASFDFDVKYRQAKHNNNADALSRMNDKLELTRSEDVKTLLPNFAAGQISTNWPITGSFFCKFLSSCILKDGNVINDSSE